jgi:7-cyano-7-deazaguanine synthase
VSAQEQALQPIGRNVDLNKGVFESVTGSKSDGVAIVSGGMDSVTLAYLLVKQGGRHPHLLSFNYGQRHKKELNFALWAAEELSLNWSLVDLSGITSLISNSALTSQPKPWTSPGTEGDMFEDGPPPIEVPEGHYSADNMALTVVPNRNMMMMSIATAVAVNMGGEYIAAGMHAGDHAQYPDCREEFVDSFTETAFYANEGFINRHFSVYTPFIGESKNYIAQKAFDLDVPLHMTWSCYKGGLMHCGRCGTCVERLEAIASVKNADPGWDQTFYGDKEYWKQAVAEHQASS